MAWQKQYQPSKHDQTDDDGDYRFTSAHGGYSFEFSQRRRGENVPFGLGARV
jgi:hypothetical protein